MSEKLAIRIERKPEEHPQQLPMQLLRTTLQDKIP